MMMKQPARQVLATTESLCPHCLSKIPAFRVAEGDQVYLEKTCPEHGAFRVLIWQGEPAWTGWVRPKQPSQSQHFFTEVTAGCPFDCGLCQDHRQQTCTALLEVTKRCNLHCAFCFASAGAASIGNHTEAIVEPITDPSIAVITGWLARLLSTGGPCNLQLSGGEPTVRDDLPEIIALAKSLGFDFIQLNTNGLRLAADPMYLRSLKEAGLTSVFLQFDGTEEAIHQQLRGRPLLNEKIQAIEHCALAQIGVVLVPTLVPGVNTHNIGEIIQFALRRVPTVRGVHFQPVSYFGRYPQPPADQDRITLPQVISLLQEQTAGQMKVENFKPPGCENALCSFHGNFLVQPGGELRALTKYEPYSQPCKDQLSGKSQAVGEAQANGAVHAVVGAQASGAGCCQLETAAEGARKARAYVARQWSATPGKMALTLGNDAVNTAWDGLLNRLHTHSFSISGMAFQDVWNLDLERLRDCCIHVISQEGNLIPFCAYNLTDSQGHSLYRDRR